MEYILLGMLFLLFLLSYFSTGRDFFAPNTMMVISFLLACIFSIYVAQDVGYHIRSETMWLIVGFLFVGVITGALCRGVVAHFRVKEIKETSTPLSSVFSIFCIGFAMVTAVLYLRFIRQIAGTGSLSQIMTVFRNANSYSTDADAQTPMYLKQMMNLIYAIAILHGYDLIQNFAIYGRRKKLLNITVISATAVVSFLSGGRFTALMSIVACIALVHFVRIQKMGKYKTYSVSFLVKMFVLVLLAAVLFYVVKEMVGRVSDDSFLDYIAHYFGTGIINLDLFLKNPPRSSDIWGKETFYAIINILRRLGVVDVEHYLFHREFRRIYGYSLGNVYTMFRGLLYDFGHVGALVGFVLFCIITSTVYEITKRNRKTKWILVYSAMYFCFPLASYNDFFFSQVISVGFFIKCIMIILLYELFSKKRIRFVMKKK